MHRSSRRRFIAGLGMASIAGLAPGVGGGGAAHAAETLPEVLGVEYLTDPGLIHLNTGTFGSTSLSVLTRVREASEQFESNPVIQGYREVGDTLLAQAERERARCAAFLGCTADEMLITHGTADALGQVASAIDFGPGDRILTSGAEHDSGVLCWRWLARRRGGHLDVVPIAPEETDTEAIVARFAAALRPHTRVICVSDTIAWTGLRMPIRQLAELAHAHGALMVVDGAQSVGNHAVDVVALGVDAYAASGHKWMCGPKGTGFLYVKSDPAARIFPVAWEDKRRLNSEAMGGCPLPLVVGLGLAVERAQERTLAGIEAHNLPLRNRLWKELPKIPGIRVVGPPPGPLATALVGFRLADAVDAGKVRAALLAKHRINIRQVDKKQFNGLRASLHVYNDDRHVDALLSALRAELA
jgi:selenocysteine lyase/cysteine desulfurase